MKAKWGKLGLIGLLFLSGVVVFGIGQEKQAVAGPIGTPFRFAEGYVSADFHEFLCIVNTSSNVKVAQVTYIFGDGTSLYKEYAMSPRSRFTVCVNGEVGDTPGKDVSMKVFTGDTLYAPERVMYFNYQGWCTGGHVGMGVLAGGGHLGPSYFAEGYTGAGFDEYLLVANFSPTEDGTVTFNFQTEEAGEIVRGPYPVPASTRKTWKVNEILGSDYNNSVVVSCVGGEDMTVERAMYFAYQGRITDGTSACFPGTNNRTYGVSSELYFAEGCTRNNSTTQFATYFTIQNWHDYPVDVRVTYLLAPGQGDPVTKDYTVLAKHRKTVYAENDIGTEKDFGAKIESLTPIPGKTAPTVIYAERPMYFNYPLYYVNRWVNCDGGHCVTPRVTDGANGIFPEGCTRAGFDEWLLLVNFADAPRYPTIKYYLATGEVQTTKVTLEPHSRLSIKVNDVVGSDQEVSVDFPAASNVLCERSMYFIYNGWTGGTGRL